jgi:phage FluMu gp28-like protein
MCREVACALDPVAFAEIKLEFFPTEFQKRILRSEEKRLIVLAHRQLGKTTILALKVLWRAIYRLNTLHVVVASNENQAKELLLKVQQFSVILPEIGKTQSSMSYVTFENGSRILCLSGREQAARGYSSPDTITVDEASRVDDLTWLALVPMTLRGNTQVTLISTPNGQRGFFYRMWMQDSTEWTRFSMKVSENPDLNTGAVEALRKMFLLERDYRQECENSFEDPQGAFFPGELIRRAMTGRPGLELASTNYTTGKPGITL